MKAVVDITIRGSKLARRASTALLAVGGISAILLVALTSSLALANDENNQIQIVQSIRTIFGNKIQIVEPGRTLFGKSYNELTGEWWNWGLKEPAETNVILDETGMFCDLNQSGKVWFLAGNFFTGTTVRECTVPIGKALFFPLVNAVSFAPEFPEEDNPCRAAFGTGVEGVRCDANDDIVFDRDSDLIPDLRPVSVTIDDLSTPEKPDVTVSDLFAYRAQSQPGGYTQRVPEGSFVTQVFGFPAGDRSPAVADGYWIFVEPLLPGKYEVQFKARNTGTGEMLDVTYLLTIGGIRSLNQE